MVDWHLRQIRFLVEYSQTTVLQCTELFLVLYALFLTNVTHKAVSELKYIVYLSDDIWD